MQQYVYNGKSEKDYDTNWMAYRNFYLGWKVVISPVAERFIKGGMK